MSAVVIDGRMIGRNVLDNVEKRARKLLENGVEAHLAVVIVGEDPASHVYVRNKERACEKCRILSTRIDMPGDSSQEEILGIVEDLNADKKIHGILVQSPAPAGVDELAIASSILPSKDVDGFHPANLGKLVQGDNSGLLPCTPTGVMHILESSQFELEGKRALVIGRSRIVGMPMALMLAQKGADATVTIAHSKTADMEEICMEADIIISAIGRPHIIGPDSVKPGSFVVDVGISRMDDGSLAGDVHPSVEEIAGWITPVPGGVGPMTIAMLMRNTIRAAESLNN